MGKFIDLTGMKFGKLTVIKRVENREKETCWLCKCECGNEKVTRTTFLTNGSVMSCGCYVSENLKEFDELPQELKDKFNMKQVTLRSQKAYVDFINQLQSNGDVLLSNYCESRKEVMIKWKKCGHEAPVTPYHYKTGSGCRVCDGKIVQKGVNDIATTHPHLVKYFLNEDDATKYGHGSRSFVDFKCPKCNSVKKIQVCTLVRQGLGCNFCSDGVSYPEKIFANILKQLNIDFKTQIRLSDYKYKYDFLVNDNCIFEVHGGQHYKDSKGGHGWKSYEVEHENDMIKYDIAVIHNYTYNKNYFIINAEFSNIDWIRNSVEKCLFFKDYDLELIDWNKIDEDSQKSKKKEVINFYNSHKNCTLQEIADNFNISISTVSVWLRQGANKDLCDYNRSGKKEVICLNTLEIFDSTGIASKRYNVDNSSVGKCCRGKQKTGGKHPETGEPLKWMYYDEYLKLHD